MALTNQDIKFFNSGTGNNLGLGGEISPIELQDRLFKDVSETQVENGFIDYKCVYIKNISPTDTMYKFSVNVTDNGYSDVQVGFPGVTRCSDNNCSQIFNLSYEEQIYTFDYSSGITGELDLFYGDSSNNKYLPITWNSNTITGINNNNYLPCQIKRGLLEREIIDIPPGCSDVCTCNFDLEIYLDYINGCLPASNCSCVSDSTWNDNGRLKCSLQLRIKFPEGRRHELLTMPIPDELSRGPDSVFNNGKLQLSNTLVNKKGGPINLTAESISSSTTIPKFNGSDITFFNNSETIVFDELKPGDYLPVWVKRIVIPRTDKISDDGFTFNITAYSTPNTTIPPTTTPFVNVIDQKQDQGSVRENAESGKVYWQTFRAGYTGNLTNIELGFTKDDVGTLSGKGDLRIYKGNSTGSPPQSSDILYSSGRSGINITIINNDLNWNNYEISNVSVKEGDYYIIAYTPRFNHKLLLNGNNCYSCGVFGVDLISRPQQDMLFKTYVYTNMSGDGDSDNCNSCS